MSHRESHLTLVRPAHAATARVVEPSDRRADDRLTLSELSWLERVRLKYGPAVALIDLSPGGAQIEIAGRGLAPGATVVIELAGEAGELAIPSRVVRCQIAGIAPCPTYRGALEFKRRFELPRVAPIVADAAANPVHDHARLVLTLRRAAAANPFDAASGFTHVGEAALDAMLAALESPAARRAGAPFLHEASRLIQIVIDAVESSAPPASIVAGITERLRRSVPARSVRVVHDSGPVAMSARDALSFEIPRTRGGAGKLLVEFPAGCQIEGWHLQLLKTSVQMLSLAEEIDDARTQAHETAKRDAIDAEAAGLHRLVVRYADGRLLKGFGRDFQPARGVVHVWPTAATAPESAISVPVSELKAVFFVHDFDRAPAGLANVSTAHGRRVRVTFADGEVIEGATLNYDQEAPGFFVTPTAAGSNNLRVFVVNRSVVKAQRL